MTLGACSDASLVDCAGAAVATTSPDDNPRAGVDPSVSFLLISAGWCPLCSPLVVLVPTDDTPAATGVPDNPRHIIS